MNNLSIIANQIPSMSEIAIDKVRQWEEFSLTLPQVNIDTSHIIHAGMYARTIMIPADTILTGVVIKIATTLIVCGDVIVYMGDSTKELKGYNVFTASANRKQAFLAQSDVYLTMVFPTDATTVLEAENEFTDEVGKLMSNSETSYNDIIITGE